MTQRDTVTDRREDALLLELIADLTDMDGQALLEENQRLARQKGFPSAVDAACKRCIRRYFFRKRTLRGLRQCAACLLALLVLGGTCFAVNAGIEIAMRRWNLVEHGRAEYQFWTRNTDDPLGEYLLSGLPEGYECTIANLNDSNHLKIYEGDGPMLMLEYCQMIREESFSVTSPVNDGPTKQCAVEINGLPGTCYVSSNASRPSRVVWLDYDAKVAFILTGLLSSEELIALAESVSVIK